MKSCAMMRGSDDSEKVEMTVIAQIPDLQDGDEVLISAFGQRLCLTAAGTPIPDLPDGFLFRLTIPVFTSFQFHLDTRRQPSPLPLDRGQDEVVEGEPHPEEEVANGNSTRNNRTEWYGHLVVATPDWRTVFISWGDVFNNWMKSPGASGPVELTVLMMVRCQKDQPKQRLRLRLLKLRSYDQDDDDEEEEEDEEEEGGRGEEGREISSSEKEFPLGSGCYWIRGPTEIVRNPSKFCLEVTDQNNRKSVHRQLHVTWSELPVGESAFKSCVVCCEVHPNAGPVPVPRLSVRATPHSVNDLALDQYTSAPHNTHGL